MLSVDGQVETRSEGAPQGGPDVPAMMVNVPDRPPVASVTTRAPAEGALQDTGTLPTNEPKSTVGWPASLLHSRMLPGEEWSKPDPVTVTFVPPFRQVPGVTVMLGGPATVPGCTLHGLVVVVVAVGDAGVMTAVFRAP